MFVLGERSEKQLAGVHPALVLCVRRALALTRQDFCVLEGARSAEQQEENVARGVSWTTESKHLRQPDGWAHAVDLVPWHDDTPRWEWPLIYPVAEAMRAAAQEQVLALRWGGVWDRPLAQCGASAAELQKAVQDYCVRHAGPDHIDGPHFELITVTLASQAI